MLHSLSFLISSLFIFKIFSKFETIFAINSISALVNAEFLEDFLTLLLGVDILSWELKQGDD